MLIDDCSSVFDISSACTLLASNESRYMSAELVRGRCLGRGGCGERGDLLLEAETE